MAMFIAHFVVAARQHSTGSCSRSASWPSPGS